MKIEKAKRAATIIFRLARDQRGVAETYLVPANACPVVPLAILKAGKKVEFFDIDPHSLCLPMCALKERLLDKQRPDVAGIIFIRTYGAIEESSIDFAALRKISPATIFVDDRCAAIPELDELALSTSDADVYLYSTGYGKYVDLGVGGYAYINSKVAYERDNDETPMFSKDDYLTLDVLCKAHLENKLTYPNNLAKLLNLSWLDIGPLELEWEGYVNEIFEKVDKISAHKALADEIYSGIIPHHVFLGRQFNLWRHQILVDNKTLLLEKIFASGLFASGHYATVARMFTSRTYRNSDRLHSRVVNLFNDFYVSEKQMIDTATIVKEHVEKYNMSEHSAT